MNTLLKVKNNILAKSFNSKVSALINNAIKNESNDLLIHNNGNICRENSHLVTFKHDFAPGIYLRQMTMCEDSVVLAQNAATILWAQDIRAWVERSRSKGCHVWVFAQEWVEAAIMRKALMAALQLTGAPYDAVFPKQDSLDGPPGNYMRLPYGGKRPAGRQEILDSDGDPLEYYDFVIAAEEQRTTLDLLRHAATYYKSPVSTQPDLPPARDYSKDPLMRVDGTRLRGLAKQMYENGPVPYYRSHGAGRGRHGFLNRFARAMLESGYSVPDVTSWTKDLDGRLGSWWDDGPKFTGRNDCDRQIERLIADARTRAG